MHIIILAYINISQEKEKIRGRKKEKSERYICEREREKARREGKRE